MPTLDPGEMSPKDIYFLMSGIIVPRPIAFVSTVSAGGVFNCAPFSYFMGVSSVPPILAISVGNRRDGSPKDTAANIRANGEFAVNVVSEELARQCVDAAADVPPEVDEFLLAGLHPLPSELIGAPRIRESPVQMECRLERILEVGAAPQHLILGEILRFHIAEPLWRDGSVDVETLRPLARLGGQQYARIRDPFEIV